MKSVTEQQGMACPKIPDPDGTDRSSLPNCDSLTNGDFVSVVLVASLLTYKW